MKFTEPQNLGDLLKSLATIEAELRTLQQSIQSGAGNKASDLIETAHDYAGTEAPGRRADQFHDDMHTIAEFARQARAAASRAKIHVGHAAQAVQTAKKQRDEAAVGLKV